MQLGTVTTPFYLLVTANFPFALFNASGKVSMQSQVGHPEPDCYYAIWTTSQYRPQRVVQSSVED